MLLDYKISRADTDPLKATARLARLEREIKIGADEAPPAYVAPVASWMRPPRTAKPKPVTLDSLRVREWHPPEDRPTAMVAA
jgi:hypothetical protein